MIMNFRMNNPDMKPSYWMMDPGEGGGAVLGEGCHIFDLMAWFAESEPISAFAHRVVFPSDEVSGKNNIACILPFKNGSIGNLIYETIGHNGMGSERAEISANGVTAIVDDMRRLTIWKGSTALFSRPRKEKTFVAEKGYYGLLNAFIEGIQEGRSFEADVIAGARATLCALAAIQSLESGQPEKIEIS
jgi:predicted dehydrogenase